MNSYPIIYVCRLLPDKPQTRIPPYIYYHPGQKPTRNVQTKQWTKYHGTMSDWEPNTHPGLHLRPGGGPIQIQIIKAQV